MSSIIVKSLDKNIENTKSTIEQSTLVAKRIEPFYSRFYRQMSVFEFNINAILLLFYKRNVTKIHCVAINKQLVVTVKEKKNKIRKHISVKIEICNISQFIEIEINS